MRKAFGGDRAVWVAAAVVWLIGGAMLAHHLLRQQEHLTGTNTAPATDQLATLEPGDRLCQEDVPVPDGTGRVQMVLGRAAGTGTARVEVVGDGRRSTGRTVLGTGAADPRVPIEPVWKADGDAALADVCVSGAGVIVHGQPQKYPADGVLRLGSDELGSRVSLRFWPPEGETTSLAALTPDIFERAALFRPAPIAPWTYWLVFFLVLPAGAVVAVRAVARGAATRRALLTIGAIAVVNAAAWALITPAFNAPDEQAHFAYVEHLARTGDAPQRGSGDRPPFSTQEANALNGIKTFAFHTHPTRPPWTSLDETRWQRATDGGAGLPTDDGGGVTTASTHQALYYGVVGVPAYWAGSSGGTFSELTLMRLLSALLAGLVALCAALTVRELLPRWPGLAVAAGALVAFVPTFSFISGSVNNDTGVNALAAVTILLLVRALRRGLSWPAAAVLGVLAVALPAAKGTGYELYPIILVAAAALALRWWRAGHEPRRALPAVALVTSFAAAYLGWRTVAAALDPAATGALGGGDPLQAGTHSVGLFLSYLWQTFLPKLPFMDPLVAPGWTFFDVYVKQSWAVFGWTVVAFPNWVYWLALAVMAPVGGLGVAALVRYSRAVKARWAEALVIVLVPLAVVAGVAYVLAIDGQRPLPFEQGRYLFPALVALAALAVGACTVLGRRWAPVAAGALVACTTVLAAASYALALSAWYS